jgi:putative transport protein
MSYMPKLLKIDVQAEAQAYAEKRVGSGMLTTASAASTNKPTVRAYRVEKPDLVGKKDVELESMLGDLNTFPGELQRIRRGEEVFSPGDDTVLEIGDVVAVIGFERAHNLMPQYVGPEVIDNDLVDRSMESRRIIVSNRDVEGKTLAEMDFSGHWQCWLTQVARAGVALPRRPELRIQRGDVLVLTGVRSKLDALAKAVGYQEAGVYETDLVTLAFGVALGVFLGTFGLKLGATSISLGTAGGVLLVGLFFGLLHSQKPTFGRLPAAARYILMELGLLLFMQHIAVSAGETIVETFLGVGPKLVLCGIAVTLTPVFACFIVGRAIFRMNAALLLGAITGALTSTAALQQVNKQAQSTLPMLGYVGTYTFANVMLAIAGAVIVRF